MKEAALGAGQAAAKVFELRAAVVAITPIGEIVLHDSRGGVRSCF